MVLRRNLLSLFSTFCIALFFLSSQSLSAQINSEKGAIRVGLTDAQGGTVAGAKVSVTSKTGAAQTKDSNPDGSTVFPLLDRVLMKLQLRALISSEQFSITSPSTLPKSRL